MSKLKQAIELSWARDTTYWAMARSWSKNNPACGQCAVTALAVQEFLGGQIVSGVAKDGTIHFWNRILGIRIDLTRKQFKTKMKFKYIYIWKRAQLLSTGNVQERYDRFLTRVDRNLTELIKKGKLHGLISQWKAPGCKTPRQ
jgi:hypothetical protein